MASTMGAEAASAAEPDKYLSVIGGYVDLQGHTKENVENLARDLGNAVTGYRSSMVPCNGRKLEKRKKMAASYDSDSIESSSDERDSYRTAEDRSNQMDWGSSFSRHTSPERRNVTDDHWPSMSTVNQLIDQVLNASSSDQPGTSQSSGLEDTFMEVGKRGRKRNQKKPYIPLPGEENPGEEQ